VRGVIWPPPQRVELSDHLATAASAGPPVIGDCDLPPQGYRITLRDHAVSIEASDAAGARYAAATLAQLHHQYGTALPVGIIEDWPAIPVRGVMLDVSRCRVPSLATLKLLFDRLATWKVNHVELYLEHTFAYTHHEEVWRDASAYTAAEIRELDDYAHNLGIELTGQQNCLGHMERWLKHDRYKPLAISPDGFTAPWGQAMPPMTADPTKPETLALARELFGELLPNFRSRRAHVGLDEPWELAEDRANAWVTYLQALRDAPELTDHDLLAWDDVLVHNPELLERIPAGVTICDWGYEAAQPFDERAAELKAMGLPFWLCPGTSAWNTVAGRWTNATTNIKSAADAGLANGAEGVMVTDWGDQGHVQHHVVSEPMFAWHAGCGWNPAACAPEMLDDVVDLAEPLRLLGDAHTLVGPQVFNSSVLCIPMYRPESRYGHGRMTTGITVEDLQRCAAQVAAADALVDGAPLDRADADVVRAEVHATARLLALLIDVGIERVRADGTLSAASDETLASFTERVNAIDAEHRRIWSLRNRPGGLDESLANFDRLRGSFLR
jgi:hypothetical protein